MLGDSSVLPGTDDVAATATTATPVHEGGEVGVGVGPGSGEEDKNSCVRIDEGDRTNYGANRWPRKETLALLKIRADMDAVFRESSHKGPLWEVVSRKLAELGYNRSPKKCKEKFENVYKYHKRTKEGRTGKSEGKTYRFFDQLEAFDQNHPSHPTPPSTAPPSVQPPQNAMATATATAAAWPSWTNHPNSSHVTVPSTTAIPVTIISQNAAVTQTTNPTIPTLLSTQPPANPSHNSFPSSFQSLSTHLFSSTTSSSTASDEELEGSRKRKRNWKDFFERLTKEVTKKQEELQRKFLETVEKHERERMVSEDAWRMQEMARIKREHELLIQETSAAAAKDAAVIAFLQKISGQQTITLAQAQDNPPQSTTQLPFPPPPPPVPPSLSPPPASLAPTTNSTVPKRDTNGENNVSLPSSSRWPKVEVHALIRLRTSLDTKYQENLPKGPLWVEISAGMQKLGYNRSAKRCKEKWENINKYFKKVKENNRIRPEDSKTCPYFHQLDALYREKSKLEGPANSGHHSVKPMSTIATEPLMVMPEQQWPPPLPENNSQTQTREGQDAEREKMDHRPIDEEMEEEEEEDEEEEKDGDDKGGGFDMVPKKPGASQMGNGE